MSISVQTSSATAALDQGDEVFDPDGRSAVLGMPIGSGGEGRVFRLDRYDNAAVKIFSQPSDPARQKISTMIEMKALREKLGRHVKVCRKGRSEPASAWPARHVYDSKRRWIGYAMPFVGWQHASLCVVKDGTNLQIHCCACSIFNGAIRDDLPVLFTGSSVSNFP